MRPNTVWIAYLAASSRVPSQLYREKPIAQAVCLFSSDVSFIMRHENRYEAAGVGGAYYAAAIDVDRSQSYYMPTSLEATISAAGELRYLTKTVWHEGLFYTHDYLGALTTVCPLMTIQEDLDKDKALRSLPAIHKKHFQDFDSMSVVIRDEGAKNAAGVLASFSQTGCGDAVRWGQSREGEIRLVVELSKDRALAIPLPEGVVVT